MNVPIQSPSISSASSAGAQSTIATISLGSIASVSRQKFKKILQAPTTKEDSHPYQVTLPISEEDLTTISDVLPSDNATGTFTTLSVPVTSSSSSLLTSGILYHHAFSVYFPKSLLKDSIMPGKLKCSIDMDNQNSFVSYDSNYEYPNFLPFNSRPHGKTCEYVFFHQIRNEAFKSRVLDHFQIDNARYDCHLEFLMYENLAGISFYSYRLLYNQLKSENLLVLNRTTGLTYYVLEKRDILGEGGRRDCSEVGLSSHFNGQSKGMRAFERVKTNRMEVKAIDKSNFCIISHSLNVEGLENHSFARVTECQHQLPEYVEKEVVVEEVNENRSVGSLLNDKYLIGNSCGASHVSVGGGYFIKAAQFNGTLMHQNIKKAESLCCVTENKWNYISSYVDSCCIRSGLKIPPKPVCSVVSTNSWNNFDIRFPLEASVASAFILEFMLKSSVLNSYCCRESLKVDNRYLFSSPFENPSISPSQRKLSDGLERLRLSFEGDINNNLPLSQLDPRSKKTFPSALKVMKGVGDGSSLDPFLHTLSLGRSLLFPAVTDKKNSLSEACGSGGQEEDFNDLFSCSCISEDSPVVQASAATTAPSSPTLEPSSEGSPILRQRLSVSDAVEELLWPVENDGCHPPSFLLGNEVLEVNSSQRSPSASHGLGPCLDFSGFERGRHTIMLQCQRDGLVHGRDGLVHGMDGCGLSHVPTKMPIAYVNSSEDDALALLNECFTSSNSTANENLEQKQMECSDVGSVSEESENMTVTKFDFSGSSVAPLFSSCSASSSVCLSSQVTVNNTSSVDSSLPFSTSTSSVYSSPLTVMSSDISLLTSSDPSSLQTSTDLPNTVKLFPVNNPDPNIPVWKLDLSEQLKQAVRVHEFPLSSKGASLLCSYEGKSEEPVIYVDNCETFVNIDGPEYIIQDNRISCDDGKGSSCSDFVVSTEKEHVDEGESKGLALLNSLKGHSLSEGENTNDKFNVKSESLNVLNLPPFHSVLDETSDLCKISMASDRYNSYVGDINTQVFCHDFHSDIQTPLGIQEKKDWDEEEVSSSCSHDPPCGIWKLLNGCENNEAVASLDNVTKGIPYDEGTLSCQMPKDDQLSAEIPGTDTSDTIDRNLEWNVGSPEVMGIKQGHGKGDDCKLNVNLNPVVTDVRSNSASKINYSKAVSVETDNFSDFTTSELDAVRQIDLELFDRKRESNTCDKIRNSAEDKSDAISIKVNVLGKANVPNGKNDYGTPSIVKTSDTEPFESPLHVNKKKEFTVEGFTIDIYNDRFQTTYYSHGSEKEDGYRHHVEVDQADVLDDGEYHSREYSEAMDVQLSDVEYAVGKERNILDREGNHLKTVICRSQEHEGNHLEGNSILPVYRKSTSSVRSNFAPEKQRLVPSHLFSNRLSESEGENPENVEIQALVDFGVENLRNEDAASEQLEKTASPLAGDKVGDIICSEKQRPVECNEVSLWEGTLNVPHIEGSKEETRRETTCVSAHDEESDLSREDEYSDCDVIGNTIKINFEEAISHSMTDQIVTVSNSMTDQITGMCQRNEVLDDNCDVRPCCSKENLAVLSHDSSEVTEHESDNDEEKLDGCHEISPFDEKISDSGKFKEYFLYCDVCHASEQSRNKMYYNFSLDESLSHSTSCQESVTCNDERESGEVERSDERVAYRNIHCQGNEHSSGIDLKVLRLKDGNRNLTKCNVKLMKVMKIKGKVENTSETLQVDNKRSFRNSPLSVKSKESGGNGKRTDLADFGNAIMDLNVVENKNDQMSLQEKLIETVVKMKGSVITDKLIISSGKLCKYVFHDNDEPLVHYDRDSTFSGRFSTPEKPTVVTEMLSKKRELSCDEEDGIEQCGKESGGLLPSTGKQKKESSLQVKLGVKERPYDVISKTGGKIDLSDVIRLIKKPLPLLLNRKTLKRLAFRTCKLVPFPPRSDLKTVCLAGNETTLSSSYELDRDLESSKEVKGKKDVSGDAYLQPECNSAGIECTANSAEFTNKSGETNNFQIGVKRRSSSAERKLIQGDVIATDHPNWNRDQPVNQNISEIGQCKGSTHNIECKTRVVHKSERGGKMLPRKGSKIQKLCNESLGNSFKKISVKNSTTYAESRKIFCKAVEGPKNELHNAPLKPVQVIKKNYISLQKGTLEESEVLGMMRTKSQKRTFAGEENSEHFPKRCKLSEKETLQKLVSDGCERQREPGHLENFSEAGKRSNEMQEVLHAGVDTSKKLEGICDEPVITGNKPSKTSCRGKEISKTFPLKVEKHDSFEGSAKGKRLVPSRSWQSPSATEIPWVRVLRMGCSFWDSKPTAESIEKVKGHQSNSDEFLKKGRNIANSYTSKSVPLEGKDRVAHDINKLNSEDIVSYDGERSMSTGCKPLIEKGNDIGSPQSSAQKKVRVVQETRRLAILMPKPLRTVRRLKSAEAQWHQSSELPSTMRLPKESRGRRTHKALREREYFHRSCKLYSSCW